MSKRKDSASEHSCEESDSDMVMDSPPLKQQKLGEFAEFCKDATEEEIFESLKCYYLDANPDELLQDIRALAKRIKTSGAGNLASELGEKHGHDLDMYAGRVTVPTVATFTMEEAREANKAVEMMDNFIGNVNFSHKPRKGRKYPGYIVEANHSEIAMFGQISGALSGTGSWQPGYGQCEKENTLINGQYSAKQNPADANVILNLRAIGSEESPQDGIGVGGFLALDKLDRQQLLGWIVEDVKKFAEGDASDPPVADITKGFSRTFETVEDIIESSTVADKNQRVYHPRIKSDDSGKKFLSLIMDRPALYDFKKYMKPTDVYKQDFFMADTPNNNLDTFLTGLCPNPGDPTGLKKKPIARSYLEADFVTATEGPVGNPTNKTKTLTHIKTCDYDASSRLHLKRCDAFLRNIRQNSGLLAVVSLPNRISANLDVSTINLSLPYPCKVHIIGQLQSMGGASGTGSSAPTGESKSYTTQMSSLGSL